MATDRANAEPEFIEAHNVPHIVIDCVASSGMLHGIYQICVGAQDLVRGRDGKLKTVITPTANLRMSPAAARDLMTALQHLFEIEKGVGERPKQGAIQ